MADDAHSALAAPPQLLRAPLNVAAFAAALEAGAFAHLENQVELVRGEAIAMPMDGGAHLNVGARLGELWWPILVANPGLRARMRLFVPGALRLSPDTARAPDAMLAPPGAVGPKRWPTAAECFLAVEFADTSLRYDEGEKRPDYAAAGLLELWIVRLAHGDVRVCRDPHADGGWGEETLVKGEGLLTPRAAPELAIPARALFED